MSSRFWSESSVPARANACAATAWAIPDVHGARPAANGKSYSQTIDRPTATARATSAEARCAVAASSFAATSAFSFAKLASGWKT